MKKILTEKVNTSIKGRGGETAFEIAQRTFNESPEACSERTLEVIKNEMHKRESSSSNERLANVDSVFGLGR